VGEGRLGGTVEGILPTSLPVGPNDPHTGQALQRIADVGGRVVGAEVLVDGRGDHLRRGTLVVTHQETVQRQLATVLDALALVDADATIGCFVQLGVVCVVRSTFRESHSCPSFTREWVPFLGCGFGLALCKIVPSDVIYLVMKPTPLVLDYIDRHFTYDPITGMVIKDGKPFGTRKKNTNHVQLAFRLDTTYQGCFLSYMTYAHQVVWYLSYGEWPDKFIDHVDGNGGNNRLDNLRLASNAQNTRNHGKGKKKTSSQYKGVTLHGKKYRAYIRFNGKHISLGSYADEKEAALVYDAKARELFGEFARLNFMRV
jgi:HNH endonuclease